MKKIFLLFTLISSFLTIAQTAPSIQWQKSLGGSFVDQANCVRQTIDGGYIIAGYSNSTNGDVTGNHGGFDYWIVKINSSGIIQWQKSLGGSGSDFATSIDQTIDGGYIVAGDSSSIDGNVSGHHGASTSSEDCWIVKLDSEGNIQWEKSLGGNSSDYAKSIKQTTDGGYIFAGHSVSTDGDVSGNHGGYDYWIVKLDDRGNIQWQKSLGGTKDDYARSVQQTADSGYVIAGSSFSNDGDVSGHHGSTNREDYWVIKLDNSGSIQWQKSLGGSGIEQAWSVQQTTDVGYIVAGSSSSTDGDLNENEGITDYWIVKLNSNGSIKWQKSFGGSDYDNAASVQQTTDGGYIVAGYSSSNDGDVIGNHGATDSWILKLDGSGNIAWQKSLGGSGDDGGVSIQQSIDGGYIIAGGSTSSNGDVTVNHGYYDYWIVKLSAEGLATQEADFTKINIYPNPIKDILNFSEEVSNVKITDVSGTMVKQISAKGKSIDVSALTKGVYIISATTRAGETVNRKIVKE
ncbi:T9SS type A sorting domain-containing protein [Kaistella jeonii]|uniref:T9SS type A sorting domain-containing protein n=1 Tax=Kaistella jeonii TaxID=266749 RepID=UPI00068AAFB3|nr:T9SS type A sorting domain-containing protein [Kaistella jeonii]SFB79707.1 Por secretion system C-terminal sorting domain-containing protein [Kaistella jeonii]VEI96249.1 Por secretion system C-terminal sorting domain [Kaistella jeonii]